MHNRALWGRASEERDPLMAFWTWQEAVAGEKLNNSWVLALTKRRKCRTPSPWADRGRKDGVAQESKVGDPRMQERKLELLRFSEKSHCFCTVRPALGPHTLGSTVYYPQTYQEPIQGENKTSTLCFVAMTMFLRAYFRFLDLHTSPGL